jgi:hypothetical protein
LHPNILHRVHSSPPRFPILSHIITTYTYKQFNSRLRISASLILFGRIFLLQNNRTVAVLYSGRCQRAENWRSLTAVCLLIRV